MTFLIFFVLFLCTECGLNEAREKTEKIIDKLYKEIKDV